MSDSPRLSVSTPVAYQSLAGSDNAKSPSVVGAANSTSKGDSTKPSFLGSGSFSLFGISFNLFGNSGKAKTPAKPDGSISTESLNASGTNTQPKLSLKQKISSFFFGPPTTDGSSAQKKKESNSSLLSWFSKMFGSKGTKTQGPPSVRLIDDSPEVDTISFNTSEHIQGSGGEKKDIRIELKRESSQKITDQESLKLASDDLAEINQGYHDAEPTEEKPQGPQIDSFNLDANRGFTYRLEKTSLCASSITNQEATLNDSETPGKNPRVIKAHQVTDTTAEAIFPETDDYDHPDNATFRKTLSNNLKGISQQALFSTPLKVFTDHPPSPGTCLIQGQASHGDFSYSITGLREITIRAIGTFSKPQDNTLIGIVNGNATPLGSENINPQGTVSLDIVAKIGEDGKITALHCTSLETSWNIKSK
ncbi:MAG: hypothetical protein K2W97_05875 [Chthoniobacterales bacterium]|nr:hypothetical protein [Chthoniobacterales bacterium]